MKRSRMYIGMLLVLTMIVGLILGGCGNITPNASNKAETKQTEKSAVEPAKEDSSKTPSANAAAAKKMRLAWTVARQDDHPYTVAAETFKKVVEEQTKGSVQIDLYPGGQLGADADIFQAIQLGNIDVAVLSAPVIAGTTKVLAGTDMPYIFDNDYDLMYKAESGEPGKKLLKRLEEEVKGVKALTFVYQPFRHFFSKKEIKTLADMKGMKLRCMQSPVHIDIFKALGTTPTPTPYTEVYTSMQSGTIDGFESDVVGANASKFYEVAKYITVSGHFNNAVVLLMSQKAFIAGSSDEQKAFQAAAEEAAKASLATTKSANEKNMQIMKDKGVKINTVDMAEFVAAEKPVIEKYSSQIPEVKEFVDAVMAMKKK